jgi:hypothetical protein
MDPLPDFPLGFAHLHPVSLSGVGYPSACALPAANGDKRLEVIMNTLADAQKFPDLKEQGIAATRSV